MRLPADATLIVLGAEGSEAAEPAAVEANVTALLAAWRAEALPIVYVRRASGATQGAFGACAPLPGERVVERGAGEPFDGSALGEALDALGATTLVLCGDAAAMPEVARAAAVFGCHAFVVADACWGGDLVEFAALLASEDAKVVDCAAALGAATLAKARQRRETARRR
jgi:nicotinamidase-related amidase